VRSWSTPPSRKRASSAVRILSWERSSRHTCRCGRAAHPTTHLKRELLAFARRRLGPAVAPREIEFEQNLPRTRSGKVMRRVLRAREMGLPEGDLSTVETPG
jgi:acyl-CoA synthetase (AMP-forming)/AMP-acid ligase II